MKTMTRRSLSIVLAVMMVVSSMLTCAITANAATDWYLVGSSTSIFGASWSPAQAANKMDYANGVWTKTYNIKKTEHVFYKISDANGWNGQQVPNNGGNQEVDVTAGDVLTFTFDGSTLTATGAHATPVETQYYLVGDAPFFAGSWKTAQEADKMEKQADGSFTKTYTNVAKTGTAFEYKVTGASGWGDHEIPSQGNQSYTVQNEGASLTFVVKDGVLSVTEAAPTTQAPTTQAPTTQAPTTQAPTTQASVLEDGFYLAGVKGWTAADLVGYKFSANPGAENEYMLNTTLTKGDSIKVVKVESDAITAYYPALGDNYVVTDKTAGDVTIYFKEAYSDEWKDFGGHIWIAVKEEPTTQAPTTEAPTTEAPTTAAPATTKTVFFTAPDGWEGVNVYAYYEETGKQAIEYTGTWPGAAMEYAGTNSFNQKLYKYDVNTAANFIIFNYNGTEYKGAFSDVNNAYYWDGELKSYLLDVEPTTEGTTEAPTTEAPTTAPAIADGFYLAGVKGWTVTDLAGYKFEANPGAENEYMLNTTLTKGDSIKVVKVENNDITAYYPALGDNYVVTDETAGDVTIYFKEAYSDEWKDFGGHIWIAVQAEPEEDYEVTYTYNYDGEDVTVTKTIKAKASEIEAKIEANVPAINNQINTYSFDGAVKGEGNKYTAALKAVAKEYTVTINGNDLEGTYKYMDKATVNSDTDVAFVVDGQVVAYGKSYTFYVIGDTDVTTDATKTLADFASISKTAEIAADGKVTVELLASAVVEKFERMGIAFASSEKTADQIKDDVLAITAGTAKGTNVAVHNSSVTEANESGQYQFVYAPYITNGYNGKLYFYTFAVNSDNEVIVSAASEVDYATITK